MSLVCGKSSGLGNLLPHSFKAVMERSAGRNASRRCYMIDGDSKRCFMIVRIMLYHLRESSVF